MHRKLLLLSAVVFALVYCGVGTRCFAEAADVGEALYTQHRLAITYIEANNWTKADAAFQELVTKYADHPGIAEAVYYVADEYGDAKKYDKAREAYQYVVDHWPEADYAIRAQVAVVRSSILLEDDAGAEAATDSLLAKFSASKDLPKAVDHAADAYRHSDRYEKARELYRYIVQRWPEAEHAMESQRGVVLSSIRMGDDANAVSELEKLIADFGENENIARAVCEIADEYRELGRYGEALENYEYVMRTWPETEHAMEAQSGEVLTNISLKDDSAADAALNVLISKYGKSEDIEKIVKEIADECRELDRNQDAIEVYEKVVENWPECDEAIESQTYVAKLYISASDDANAQAAIDGMVAKFSQHSDLAEALDEIAEEYEKAERYGEAKNVYQLIMKQTPSSSEANEAPLDIRKVDILALIALGNDSEAQTEIDRLVADFNDNPGLAEAIYQIGKKYHDDARRDEGKGLDDEAIAHYWKAITTWQIVREKYPDSDLAMRVCYLTGDCYRKVDEREKAVECYEEILSNWPDYEYAWSAQFLIGYCYEQLKHSGAVESPVADARTKAAYERVVEEYPSCPAAPAARDWLGHQDECKCE